MSRRIIKIFIITTCIFAGVWFFYSQETGALTKSSDRLSSSWPGGLADHNIQFRTTENVPAGGKITIVFAPDFVFTSGFDINSIDLSVNSGSGFVERLLASTSSAVYDRTLIATSSQGTVLTFDLNPTQGINAGSEVLVELGTNADHQATSTHRIRNPLDPAQHEIEIRTYDDAGAYLERSGIAVFIIEPVTMGSATQDARQQGAPLGFLSYETSQTVMSLYTNYEARCRYSTSSDVSFADMENDFSYTGTSTYEYYHTVLVSGFSPGNEYSYYVRCENNDSEYDYYTRCTYPSASTTPVFTASGTPITDYDCLDYEIAFTISSIAGAEGDESGYGGPNEEGDETGDNTTDGSGSGGGGGGGTGSGVGSGDGDYLPYPPPPGAPGVALRGWGYPSQNIMILQDGTEVGVAEGKSDASFGAFVEGLTKGVYTFSLWADDSQGRRSRTYSTTFWINDGTQTTVSDILLPPTASLSASEVTAGESVTVQGESIPGSQVEVQLYPQKDDLSESEISQNSVEVMADGTWSLSLNTEGRSNGQYKVKARVIMADVGESQFSQEADLAIGAAAEQAGSCPGADLNQDGRVNITDFSILLYHWDTDNACADQNGDGTVDLIDFSIMMYNWTG